MRIGASARDRLLRRHAGEVDRLCLLALGDPARARAAAAATMELAAAGLAAGVRPPDGRPWLLALAIAECDRRPRAPSPEAGAGRSDDPWGPARRLPARERAALILHEGLGLGVRRTATALGVEWRGATDLLFSARRTLARPGDRWEPLECTVHRRRLSDAGCPRVPPALSRAHVEGCEGCRGMLSASAERRARARPAAPAPASRPRLRLARPGLALAAACAAILVGGAATLIGGGSSAPSPGIVASADVPSAPAPAARTPVPVPVRSVAAQRPRPVPHAKKRRAPRHRETAAETDLPVGREAVAEIPAAARVAEDPPPATTGAAHPRRPSGSTAPSRRAPAPARPRAPAPRRSPSPVPSAPAPPPASSTTPAPSSAPTAPAPADPPPVAAGEPTTTTPTDPAAPGGSSTTGPAPPDPPPTTTGGTTTAP